MLVSEMMDTCLTTLTGRTRCSSVSRQLAKPRAAAYMHRIALLTGYMADVRLHAMDDSGSRLLLAAHSNTVPDRTTV